jgi:regulatory protein
VQDGVSNSPNANSGKNPEYIRAEKIALRLIARAEQCSLGLKRKLEKRKIEAACADDVISHLCELKLVDDSRYAKLWIESRLRFARSPRRLLVSLCGRGIDMDEAESVLKAALDEDTEHKMLAHFAKKYSRKIRQMDGLSLKLFLKNEGFSPQAINNYINDE